MKRRVLHKLALLLAASLLLTGCGGGSGNTESTEPSTEPAKVKNEVPSEWEKTTGTLALPSEMFAFVGQPIVIYLRNITNEETDAVTFCVDAGGKGTLYDNRWEYTPTAAESFKIKIAIVRHADDTVISNEEFTITVKDKTEKESLSVLVIGDSTIYQKHETQTLLDKSFIDGYSLSLLGTLGTAPNLNEGRSGWTTSDFLGGSSRGKKSPLYNTETGAFDFTNYMNNSLNGEKVDCVVIQLGINDVKSSVSDASAKVNIRTYLKNLDTMIESIHTYNKDIKIVLNLLLPCSSDEGKFTEYFNGSLTAARCRQTFYMTNLELMKHFANANDNIYLSHANVALDVVNKMASGGTGCIHPAQAGYAQVGTQLYSILRAIN